jgi:hypothetical protein
MMRGPELQHGHRQRFLSTTSVGQTTTKSSASFHYIFTGLTGRINIVIAHLTMVAQYVLTGLAAAGIAFWYDFKSWQSFGSYGTLQTPGLVA